MAAGEHIATSPKQGTARTAPATAGPPHRSVGPRHAGLVLLYSPNYRAMAPAFLLDRPELVLGRDASCDIVLHDSAVSRRHARIANREGRWSLADLGSLNGTLVDGERVRSEVELEPMQQVRIGDALFKFVDRDAEQYARYRIDGAVDGALPSSPPELAGGFAVRRGDRELVRIAPTDLSCVILGETGTGKEVLAREIHRLSGRRGPFCPIHCGAIPGNLLESELFGYRRGAFSGAHRDKPGLVQQAHRGTLFLDEIGDMPLEAQGKLLRVLQSHEVFALGATQPDTVDLRVVCATHRDLHAMVEAGSFRGDLFARLHDHALVLPPLRERKEDVFALAQVFLARSGKRLQLGFACMMALLDYDWPFNVRELESVIKRAAVLAESGVLEPQHLPASVVQAAPPSSPRQARSRAGQGARSVAAPPGFLPGPPTEAMLRELLVRHAGNVAAIARELGKGRMQVHRWVRRYGLSVEEYRTGSDH